MLGLLHARGGLLDDEVRRGRLHAQWLAPGDEARSPAEVVRHLVGIQAQILSAASLAVRARTAGATAADVGSERAEGTLVRTWLMRRTLHLVAADDVSWLLSLLGPTLLARAARRHAQLDLDGATLERSVDVLLRLLHDGPATRAELFSGLAANGINPAGQRGIHVVQHAALRGVLCFGPDRDREPTWRLRPSSSDRTLDREQALALLGHRYRAGYRPSDPRDLAAWSGLTVTDAREAWRLAGDRKPDGADGVSDQGIVRLLPHFDPYLLGYANRDLVVPAEQVRQVWTGGGYIVPTVIVDGRAVATWRSDPRGRELVIEVSPFAEDGLGEEVQHAVDTEIADIGRFLGSEARRR